MSKRPRAPEAEPHRSNRPRAVSELLPAIGGAAFRKFGGRFLARGGESVQLEGDGLDRHVVIEFADMATALACHRSPEYQQAKDARDGACIVEITIVDGVS